MRFFVVCFALAAFLAASGQVYGVPYPNGTDYLATNIGSLTIEFVPGNPALLPTGPFHTTSLAGHTTVLHENPAGSDHNGDNDYWPGSTIEKISLYDIPTEILEFEHSGGLVEMPGVSVQTHQSQTLRSLGVVEQIGPPDFPAESFFDVFFEIQLLHADGSNLLTLFNQDALRMTSQIDALPPTSSVDPYQLHQGPLDWWPELESEVDAGYPAAPDLTGATMVGDDLRLKLYVDLAGGPFHIAYLTGHPEHQIVPEASSLICWCLIGLTAAGIGWRKRRRKAA